MRVTFVTSDPERLGIAAPSAPVQAHDRERALVCEPRPFSSNGGPDTALFTRWLEPTVQETTCCGVAPQPGGSAFSSYTTTLRWSVEVVRAFERIASNRRRHKRGGAVGREVPDADEAA